MKFVYVGLDGEMTGPRLTRHKLFEIGVASDTGPRFVSRIGWADFEYDPEALAAVGVDPAEIGQGPPAEEVDAALVAWFGALGAEAGQAIAVGWAVGRFDMPFVARTLPRACRYLNRQTVDLGALCHTFAGRVAHDGQMIDAAEWKTAARLAAAAAIETASGEAPAWHNAGYDAVAALAAWHWLRSQVTAATPQRHPLRRKSTPAPGRPRD